MDIDHLNMALILLYFVQIAIIASILEKMLSDLM
jgi:hypothetical protein